MHRIILALPALAMLIAAPLAAQLAVPGVQLPTGEITGTLDRTLDGVTDRTLRQVERLAQQRVRKIDRLVRRNRDVIELDRNGAPARRGELLAVDLTQANRDVLKSAGFGILERETVEGLNIAITRLSVPDNMDLDEAQALIEALVPEADIAPDHLHFSAGSGSMPALPMAASSSISIGTKVGIVDGATGSSVPVVATKGFAKGAPYPSNHGSAVASLLKSAGVRSISVADVYGTDPAGGNALAIARGLGWLISNGNKVVTISLVGPKNRVLERAIASAQRKGAVIVAAVGNDGPAAPAAYPASYTGVVAVTAVDKRNRALIEAGRALHLDYAAPGADIYGLDKNGKRRKLRGTSYATPLVAARAAFAVQSGSNWRAMLDREARDLGKNGPDPLFGRGLLCEGCGRK